MFRSGCRENATMRLVRLLLSEDQARALVTLAGERVLEMSVDPRAPPRREAVLLAAAVERIKEALERP